MTDTTDLAQDDHRNDALSPDDTVREIPRPAERVDPETTSELDHEGDVAADYLEGLLDILDLDGDIDLDIEAGRPLVSVVEARKGDLQHLVGRDGAVLSAVQDLTRLAVTNQTGHRSRLILDIAGHRSRRRDSIRRIAESAVAEARDSGQPVRLSAMTAFERKVVHDAVAAAGLSSNSEGVEPRRYVVVLPAD